jgi:hypothetical protein
MIQKTRKTFVYTLKVIADHKILTLVTFQWSEWQKTIQLIIITLAAIVPDFDSAIS